MIRKTSILLADLIRTVRRRRVLFARLLVLGGISLLLFTYWPVAYSEAWYFIKELKSQEYTLNGEEVSTHVGPSESIFSKFISPSPVLITPVNRGFSIVIEKIGVNAPIVANVPITSEDAYIEALKYGVAHAASSKLPSENPGNVYLFAHASVNFWQLGKYSTVFNLLRKLEYGDRIHLFYDNKDFVYEVLNREVFDGWNIYPITRPVIEPTLTLQTCDPPGTTLNRMVVTAKLVDVLE